MNKDIPKISDNYPKQRKLLIRKGVSALIINEKRKFLLVNLESFKDHFFAIPGGGLEGKETINDAVYREVQEELGIAKELLELIGISQQPIRFIFKTKKLYRNNREYDGSERYFFGFKFVGKESDIKLQQGEIRSYKWVSYENLKNYLLFANQLAETTEKILEIFTKSIFSKDRNKKIQMVKKTFSGAMPHKLPNDLRQALESSPQAQVTWEDITTPARNEWICWIISVKSKETRKHHVKRAVEELSAGKRRPCCWMGCTHRTDKPMNDSQKYILSKQSKKKK